MAEQPASSTLPKIAYRFEVYQVCPDSRQLERDFLCVVASLEAHSDHPIATEVVQIARINNVLPVSVTGLECFPGKGLGGLVRLPSEHPPRATLLGSRELITQNGLQIPELLETTAKQWESEPNAVVVFGGWDGWVRGLLKFLTFRVP